MSSPSNWLNQGLPCAGDHIVFEEDKLTVAILNRDLDVSQIDFSDTGVIYFGDNVVLGRADYQQCQRRKSPEHVFFEPKVYFGSYYDPNSWRTRGPSPYLHMKWIPSSDDEVIFHEDNVQFYMDKPTRIAKLWYANQNQTTRSFRQSVSSVEGQYKVSFGHLLADIKSIDGLEIIYPKSPPFVVQEKQLSHLETVLGRRNANMENETMALLCPYLKCEETDDCIEKVKPIGHCCSICGALVHFIGYDIGYENVKMDIKKFIKQHPILFDNYDVEIDRLDDDETPSSYQITIFKTNTDVAYDEEPIKDLLGYLEYKLHKQLRSNLKITEFQIYMSRTDKSIQLSSIVIGTILFIALVLSISMQIIRSDPILYERFSMNFRTKVSSLSFAVHFHPGRDENEIQMIAQTSQISDEHEELKSEEEVGEVEKEEEKSGKMKDEIKRDFITLDHLNGITNPSFQIINETSEELKLIDL